MGVGSLIVLPSLGNLNWVQTALFEIRCITPCIQKESTSASALIKDTDNNFFSNRRVGLEKETLRIDTAGHIAQTGHPEALGSALCNSQITTDFSESLLEMVTPPCTSVAEALEYMVGIHQFILPRLEDGEGLWNTSMPCVIDGDESIHIGRYGNSHNGIMKHVYRRGLGLRYGRRMQAIAGIHFNYSMSDISWPLWQSLHKHEQPSEFSTSTVGYFHMTRNLMRIGWMVPFLFGASPAICQTFLPSGADSDLATLNKHTRFAPFGTSLRMGEIGYRYKEDAPIDLSVRHDSFENYLSDILAHVTTTHAAYAKEGITDERGYHQQLNAKKLQIENEYYSSVRPKQIPEKGEMPLLALKREGIRYLELRSVDVNVFDPAGMHVEQLAMLEMLMVFAWLADSPPLMPDEMDANKHNVQTVAHRGREAGLKLKYRNQSIMLVDWGQRILSSLEPIAQWMDSCNCANGVENLYQTSLQQQMNKLNDPSLTPSARVVDELDQHGSFFSMAMAHSSAHKEALITQATNEALQARLAQSVPDSIAAQKELEANCEGSFEDFLSNYFSQLDTALQAQS
ncbi:UNVERIFIED_CONTAM: hypothetical protein GTU68_037124 [Idotea baltica]|nr:hypothetical protein [Idotea baltica]